MATPTPPKIRQIQFLGARGGSPVPGASTSAFGGNTAAIEIALEDGRRLYFDSGSGLQRANPAPEGPTDVFLTHGHLGHVVGLPYFAPLYDGERHVRFYSPPGAGGRPQAELALERLCFSSLSPKTPEASIYVDTVSHGATWTDQGVHVTAFRARHSGPAFGYRVRAGAQVVAYFPDNEIVGGDYDVPVYWYDEIVEFLRGVDLLIHDAMYTSAEYRTRRGMGHSAAEHAVGLAHDAGVRRLALFHHAPWRSDRDLQSLSRQLNHLAVADGALMDVTAAREGWAVRL